jgi:hypothetical protein
MRSHAVNERGAKGVGPAVITEDQRTTPSCGIENCSAQRPCILAMSAGERYTDRIKNAFFGSLHGLLRQSPELGVENRGSDLTQ